MFNYLSDIFLQVQDNADQAGYLPAYQSYIIRKSESRGNDFFHHINITQQLFGWPRRYLFSVTTTLKILLSCKMGANDNSAQFWVDEALSHFRDLLV